MKRFLLGITACLLLFSCEKETILTVDQSSVSFTDAGGSQTVTLTANKPWTVKADQSWCKISPSGGEEASSSRITITCDANATYDARNCTVTFTCAELTKTISVSQATNNGLIVSQTTYELNKAAQQVNIEVKANVKFSVEVDSACKDWIKYNATKALSTSTVVLDIAENATYDNREGKVTIKQTDGSLSSTITIKQSQVDGLFITTPEYNLSNEQHTLTVEVSTNVEFEVKPDVDWVKYVETKGLNSKQIVLNVFGNETFDSREAKVSVKQKNGDLSGTITINQDEKYGLVVSQSEFNLTNEAQTVNVTVKYNVDFDVIIPDDCKPWIVQVSTKATNERAYSFSVARNDTYDMREGSITFKQTDGDLSGTITIRQSQLDGLFVSTPDYTLSNEKHTLTVAVSTNVDFAVTSDSDWVQHIETKTLSSKQIILNVDENKTVNQREAKVTIKQKNGDLSGTIIIKQKKGDYVEFEDTNFKSYCMENFDKDGDGKISPEEAEAIIRIDVNTKNIKSLKGIERMPNLEFLTCYMNQLTDLDVSNNPALIGLFCNNNHLTNLDLSNNANLVLLDCSDNELKTLLFYPEYWTLEMLHCHNNKLTELKIENKWKIENSIYLGRFLYDLDCGYNLLTSLDLSSCEWLSALNCRSLPLTSMNVPLSVTKLPAYAFADCTALIEITLPARLSEIGDYAFQNCPALTTFKLHNMTPPTLGIQVFDKTDNCLFYVAPSAMEEYKASDQWSNYADRFRDFYGRIGSLEGIGYDNWD